MRWWILSARQQVGELATTPLCCVDVLSRSGGRIHTNRVMASISDYDWRGENSLQILQCTTEKGSRSAPERANTPKAPAQAIKLNITRVHTSRVRLQANA